MSKHELASVDELDPGESKVVTVGDRELCLFNTDGEFHALPNTCPHQQAPLCEGAVGGTVDADRETEFEYVWKYDDEVVSCPWHDLMFHVPTGNCLGPSDMDLPSFDVTVEEGTVILRD